ncbi:DUF418 domain-containing protein [Propioniciclava soli]|uniref:DUF418 domain-containing protein n=1 Tax=Propioniciclava soli TaxID=2775081 RepID=UPI001E32C9DE|nr:DUF418 domain-containing protein [Propioniciclava soli]
MPTTPPPPHALPAPRPLPPPPPPPWYLPPAGSGRSQAPDLARGVMLLLIAWANSTWYLWGRESDAASWTSAHPADGGPLDRALRAVMAVAVDGHVYPMFAFLFGYGMVQLARSRAARGWSPPVIVRHLQRRHAFLLLFGFVHALLLFAGDVLGAYGLAGLVLVALLFGARDRTLVVWTVVFACLFCSPALLTVVAAPLLWWFTRDAPELDAADLGAAGLDAAPFGSLADLFAGQTNYVVAALVRAVLWLVSTPSVVLGFTVPAMILLGWLAARRGILERPAEHRRLLTRIAVGGLGLGWLGGVPLALEHLGVLVLPVTVSWAPMTLSYALGPFAGVGYVALFGLLAARDRTPGPVGRAVAALGQRSLSGYLWQSIVMAPLLAAWGFGLGAHVTTAGVLAIASGVWLASVLIAARLGARNRPGPFEALLRRLIGPPDAAQVRGNPAPEIRTPPHGPGAPPAATDAPGSR